MVCAIQNVLSCAGVDAEVPGDRLGCVQGRWIRSELMLYVVLGVLLPSPYHCIAHRWPFGFSFAAVCTLTGIAALALLMETEHHG